MCETMGSLWLSPGLLRLVVGKYQLPCRIASRTLCCWMQGLKESYERGGLCRTQVIAISRHVAAALNYLPNELVLRQPHGNAIQGRSPLSTRVSERVAVATLFNLKYERTLAFKRGSAVNVAVGYRIAAPGVHVRTPGRELRHASEAAERNRNHQHGDHCNGTALPAFFSFSGEKRKEN